jgi:chromosomal replication initiator protein
MEKALDKKELFTAIKQNIGINNFKRWFNYIKLNEIKLKHITFQCPNQFILDWVKENYTDAIHKAIIKVFGGEYDINWFLEPSYDKKTDCPKENQLFLSKIFNNGYFSYPNFNPKYTFNNFVVGPCNQFAYASAITVAKQETKKYNPLFFYSEEGLGKTHLSNAIGQHILYKFPQAKINYITAEWFSQEMVNALRKNQISQFKEKYRKSCDVLLIEDAHFFQKKEKTQMEFFYTLDSLFQMEKQIVITSNTNPCEFVDLKNNLKSRMCSGLVVDIKKPDFETRLRIIQKWAQQERIKLDSEVVEFIAKSVKDNIRILHSVIISLIAFSSLLKKPIALDLAKETIKRLTKNKPINLETIKKFVSKYFNLEPEQLNSKSRKKNIYYPRQITFYLSRKYTNATLENIGKAFNRTHSSVIRALESYELALKNKPIVIRQLNLLTEKFEKDYLI